MTMRGTGKEGRKDKHPQTKTLMKMTCDVRFIKTSDGKRHNHTNRDKHPDGDTAIHMNPKLKTKASSPLTRTCSSLAATGVMKTSRRSVEELTREMITLWRGSRSKLCDSWWTHSMKKREQGKCRW